jgi:hypothetical protein
VRHIGSFLLAAVFGPAVFLLTGTGLSAFASARRHAFVDDPLSPLAALGALLLAGLLYGILVMVRLSPVGPGLAGIVLFGLSTWALVAPTAYDSAFGSLGVDMGGAVGQWGLGFLLGVPLLATLTSPRRWRRLPYGGDVYYAAPAALDSTRQMPAAPAYLTLPDIGAPSLHYPAGQQGPSAFTPPAAPAFSHAQPPATPVVKPADAPKPAFSHAEPPVARPATQPATQPATPPATPPAAPSTYASSGDKEKPIKIDLAGNDPTDKLEP